MRTLLRSFAALSAISLSVLSAHATTYTITPTFIDLTTAGNVTGTFSSGPGAFSFNDPPTASYVDTLNIFAKGGSDGDELALAFAFTAPGTGTASITGDAEISGRRNINGDISWDSSTAVITLSNGSVVSVSVPNFHGNAYDTSLSSCGGGQQEDSCSCPQNEACGSADVTLKVTTNDPPVAATPEPSSLALLGTGVLSVAGMIRRKYTV